MIKSVAIQLKLASQYIHIITYPPHRAIMQLYGQVTKKTTTVLEYWIAIQVFK